MREKLDGDNSLGAIPEHISEESPSPQAEGILQEIQSSADKMQAHHNQQASLVAQREHTLQEIQNSPDRLQANHSQHGKLPSQPDSAAASQSTGHASQKHSASAAPASSDHSPSPVAQRDISSEPQRVTKEAAEVDTDTTGQPLGNLQRGSQAPAPQNKTDRQNPAKEPATSPFSLRGTGKQLSQQAPALGVAVDAASAPQPDAHASGMLATDDNHDWDFELAQHMEDAARVASDTQHVQHAQQGTHTHQGDANGQTQPGSISIEPQTDLLAASDDSTKSVTARQPGAAASLPGNPQSNIGTTDAFQSTDLEMDDELARLLDAASAQRLAGLPDTAPAGPGPSSSCSSCPSSRSNSPRSRSNYVPPCPFARPKSASPFSQARHSRGAANQGQVTNGHGCASNAPARGADDGAMALEPAGPADEEHQAVRSLSDLVGALHLTCPSTRNAAV